MNRRVKSLSWRKDMTSNTSWWFSRTCIATRFTKETFVTRRGRRLACGASLSRTRCQLWWSSRGRLTSRRQMSLVTAWCPIRWRLPATSCWEQCYLFSLGQPTAECQLMVCPSRRRLVTWWGRCDWFPRTRCWQTTFEWTKQHRKLFSDPWRVE